MAEELLRVENVKKHFPVSRGIIFQKQIAAVKAVDDVSFTVNRGETFGIVGESGCGKSTLARVIMRLLDPTAGKITFEGRDISNLTRNEMRPVRREMMMIFQDPYASLNPRKRVGFIVGEALQINKMGSATEIKRRVQELLEVVGLNPEHYNRFPPRILGRPAPADRCCPRPGREPEADRRRRAGLGARRLRPGPDPQPPQGPPDGVRADLHLHRSRSQRGSLHLGPGDGDVPRQGGRDRRRGPALRRAPAPLLRIAALRRADRKPAGRTLTQVGGAAGRRPKSDQPAKRLSLPPTLPAVSRGCVRCRRAADHRGLGLPRLRLLLPSRALADDGRGDQLRRPRRRRASGSAKSCRPSRPESRPRPRFSVLLAAIRRLVILFLVLGATTAVVSALLGFLFDTPQSRAISLGFTVVGSFMLVMGFFVGSRGPVRLVRRDRGSLKGARLALPEERDEAINVSAFFVAVGFVLVVIGIVIDPRYRLL